MIYAIIVAAGKGVRMQSVRRKQFMKIGRRPILSRTLQAFDRCRSVGRLIVVVPADDFAYCQQHVLDAMDIQTDVCLVAGGKRRQDSVHNGIDAIAAEEGIVLIHDGVRPLVTEALIEASIQGARKWGACIPALSPVETPKQVDDDMVTRTISRDSLRLAQTPQAFRLSLIRQAHREAKRNNWTVTDDASLVELTRQRVHVISGLRQNIKITTPQDLELAEFYLSLKDGGY